MRFNKKGFSMVEMMVAVSIMAILSLIAIPQYRRYASHAKKANATSELAAVYGMEKAFQTEYSTYSDSLMAIGYSADGIPVDGAGCPDASKANAWPVRY